MSVSQKGFITRELYLEVLKDFQKYLEKKKIPLPVILLIDGASPHISLAALDFCRAHGIQPWLLRPNMTHLLQPLDLTLFSSLKAELKKLVWSWQCEKSNAGQCLTKYSIVVVLQQATENCLQKKGLIQNGFRRAGIYPYDPSAPDVSKLLPGQIFETASSFPIPTTEMPVETLPMDDIQDGASYTIPLGLSDSPTPGVSDSGPSGDSLPTSLSSSSVPDLSISPPFVES